MRYVILLLALISIPCQAYEGTYFKFGVGMDNNIAATKLLTFGYQAPLSKIFDYQLEGGGFIDNNQPQGVILFGSYSIGLSTFTPSGVYVKAFFGPALISSTDTRLSSIFEFNDDFELGLKDDRDVSIGLNFKHMSNAGIVGPNLGRDFLLLKGQIPF